MRELSGPARHDPLVLAVGLGAVAVDEFVHDLVHGCGILVDGNALPLEVRDLLLFGIVLYIDLAYDAGARACLDDWNAVYHLGLFHESVRVAADYHVDAPVRV